MMNYLPDAKNHDAEIFTGASVRYLERKGEQLAGSLSSLEDGRRGVCRPHDELLVQTSLFLALVLWVQPRSFCALRPRDFRFQIQSGTTSQATATCWDWRTTATKKSTESASESYRSDTVPKVGPTITGVIDMRNQPRLEDSMVIEDGSMAGAYTSLLPAIFATAAALTGEDTDSGWKDEFNEHFRTLVSLPTGGHSGALRNTQTLLVMAHDNGRGRFVSGRRSPSDFLARPKCSANLYERLASELKDGDESPRWDIR